MAASGLTVKTNNIKIIKPFSPENVILENIKYSNLNINTEAGNKWADISYDTKNPNDTKNAKILVTVRGCVVKTVTKVIMKDKNGVELRNKDGSSYKDKFQIFTGIKDAQFIEFIKNFEQSLIKTAAEHCNEWYNDEYSVEECTVMLSPTLSIHEKYGIAMGGILARDFTCKSKTSDVTDVSDILNAIKKGYELDICYNFNKIKISPEHTKIGFEISQINIINVGNAAEYIPFCINPENFKPGRISLNKLQQHEKGGKFCKVVYTDDENQAKSVRFNFENVGARIFKFDKDGPVSYSISIRLSDVNVKKMIDKIDQEIFDILLTNSKEYYSTKKTAKLLKAITKPLYSYNKLDTEKIKKGEKPTYDPSMWVKIYWTTEKGCDGKIINATTGKPINNINDILNTNLTVESLECYSRHIWFGPKGTSVNFTLNKCSLKFESTEYDMDAVSNNSDDETAKDTSAKLQTTNTNNSDDENTNYDDNDNDNE